MRKYYTLLRSLRNISYFNMKFGMKPYQVGKGHPAQSQQVVDEKIFDAKEQLEPTYLPLLKARNVKRYRLDWHGDWIKYGNHLAEPRTIDLFQGQRILVQRIVSSERLDGTYVADPFICNTDVITLKPLSSNLHIYFFLGLLLSKAVAVSLKSQNVNLDREAFPKINTKTLNSLPIPSINLKDSAEKTVHDRLVSLVETMLSLHKQLPNIQTPRERELLTRQIEATDGQIDRLVYSLYGLTEEEIAIVEGK